MQQRYCFHQGSPRIHKFVDEDRIAICYLADDGQCFGITVIGLNTPFFDKGKWRVEPPRDRRRVEARGRALSYHSTNRLVSNPHWDIDLSKTGYISEAGRCLVMQVKVESRELILVLLDSWGKYSRLGDANRIRKWLERSRALADSRG